MIKKTSLCAVLMLGGVMSTVWPNLLRGADTLPPAVNLPPLPVPTKRPTPPTRLPDGPGAPRFTVAGAKPGETELRAAPGANAPVDAEGDFLIGPDYLPAPELNVVEGVPQGAVLQFTMDSKDSKFYNPGISRTVVDPATGTARDVLGTVDPTNPKTLIVNTREVDYKRTITVYVPAQYVPGTPAPFIVTHDGPGIARPDGPRQELARVLDNLIAQKRVPVQVAVMIQNGGGDAQGNERGKEYDTMSGKFAEFIEAEVLPLVEKNAGVTLTKDPEARATMGNSSGGSAALIMAWYHPDLYRRVITTSGTYVNQQWPFNPETPGGAWEFHNKLIAGSANKPIRLWMGAGDADLLNPNVMRDDMHDWVEANHRMATVLAKKGYRYQYVFALGVGHSMGAARGQLLPEALEWVWKDYKPKM